MEGPRAGGRTHRARGAGPGLSDLRRWRRRAWQATLIVAGVATATAVRDAAPTIEDVTAPFVRTVAPGTPGRVRGLDLTVVDVEGATSVDAAPYTRPSNGVWVIVTARLHATTDSAALNYAAVHDAAGNEYRATARFQLDMLRLPVDPGVDVVGPLAFELPHTVALPLELRMARDDDTRLDVVAAVPLEVTGDDLARWAAENEPILIGPREVVP